MDTEQPPEDLLAGLAPGQREDRRSLLSWLLQRGVDVDELREAAARERLALLPTEHVLNRGCSYSLEEAAARSGLDPSFVARVWRVAGIPVPERGERVLDEEDLQAMQTARQVLDAGLSEEAYLDISRVVGRGAGPAAQSLVEVSIEHFLDPDQGEAAFAMRLEEVAEQLTPLLPMLLAFPVRMHLRDAVRHQALERSEAGVAGLAGTRRMAIAFADLVGFTALSERAGVAESGDVAHRLEDLASAVAEPPVRLVKLIGDAAMLVSEDPPKLVEALFLVRDRATEDTGLPGLRIGLAVGEVAPRAGDVYGPAVNLASRLAGIGEAGQILAGPDVAAELSGELETRELQARHIKGVGEVRPVELVGRLDAG